MRKEITKTLLTYIYVLAQNGEVMPKLSVQLRRLVTAFES